MKKIQTEARTVKVRDFADRDQALSCHHCGFWSTRGVVMVADERTAWHAGMLTKLRLFF